MDSKLTYRNVTMQDFWMLFAWRHDDTTEYFSTYPAPTITIHKTWMKVAIKDTERWIFMSEDTPCPVGTAHVNSTTNEISIQVNPLVRQKSYGTQILKAVQNMGYKRLRANIVVGNSASLHLFRKCGFDTVDMGYINNKPVLQMRWICPVIGP